MVRMTLLGVLLTAGCSGAVGQQAARSDGKDVAPRLEPCEGTPALSPAPKGAPDTPLRCLTSDGQLQLSALREPTLVNLWASWCLPCRQEMPMLQAVHERLGDEVGFLGVNVSDERDSALNFLATIGVSYPQVVDPTNLLPAQLNSPGLPVTIVIDASGAVVYQKIGELSQQDLDRALTAAGG